MKILNTIKKHVLIVFLVLFCLSNTITLKGQNKNNFEGIINYTSDVSLEEIIPTKWGISIDSLQNEISENTDLVSSYTTLYIAGKKLRLKISEHDSYFNLINKQFHCFDSTCDVSSSLSNKDFIIIEDTTKYIIRGIECKKVEVVHPLQKDVYYYSPSFFKVDTTNYLDYKIGDPFFQFICRTGHLPIKMEIGNMYTFILDNFQELMVDANHFVMPDKYCQALIETQLNVEKTNKNYKIGQEKEFLKAFLNACSTAKNLSSFICNEDIQNKNYLLLINNIGYNQLLSIDKLSSNTFLVKINIKNSLMMDETNTYLFTLTSVEGYVSLKLFTQAIEAPEADVYIGNEMTVAYWAELK